MHTHSPAPCLRGLSLVFFCSFLFFILPTPFLYTSGAISIAIFAILLPILLFVLIFVKSKSFLKHFLICVLVDYYLFSSISLSYSYIIVEWIYLNLLLFLHKKFYRWARSLFRACQVLQWRYYSYVFHCNML